MTQMDKNMWVSTIKATMCFTGYQIACRRRCGSREVYSSGLSKENLNCRKCSTMQKYRPDAMEKCYSPIPCSTLVHISKSFSWLSKYFITIKIASSSTEVHQYD